MEASTPKIGEMNSAQGDQKLDSNSSLTESHNGAWLNFFDESKKSTDVDTEQLNQVKPRLSSVDKKSLQQEQNIEVEECQHNHEATCQDGQTVHDMCQGASGVRTTDADNPQKYSCSTV